MKIINEDSVFAQMAKSLRAKREKIEAAKKDIKDNKEEYALYDAMIDNLSMRGYNNVELNLLQRYILLSKNYDGSTGASAQNILYNLALKNKLNVETIKYLGQLSSSKEDFSKSDLEYIASAKSTDQMKALYYAHSKGIPFEEIGTFNGKPPSANQIINVINNYAGNKEQTAQQQKLSFMKAKGYGDMSFLKDDKYEYVSDEGIAASMVANAAGASASEIKSYLNGLQGQDAAAAVKAKDIYMHSGLDLNTPVYSLDQLKTKSIQTLKKELAKSKTDHKPTEADKVNQHAANNNE